jgi:hypothetical protein
MNGHHLILGELVDYITGKPIPDTHDERYRQNLSRLLVRHKQYNKEELDTGYQLTVQADKNRAIIPIDFVITLADKICMIIKYGPGSLVTRHRPVLAVSRLVAKYQIPIAVVTNGERADVLSGETGSVLSQGLNSIPDRQQLSDYIQKYRFSPISGKRAAMESRIVYCYEVDDACPCDDTVCRI